MRPARGTVRRTQASPGVKRLSPKPVHAPPWPKHDYPTSNRWSTTSASNGTVGSSRRNGWRHSQSRSSGRNPHPRRLSRGGECSKPPLGSSCFYGLWASSVGAFCFQLFVNRVLTQLELERFATDTELLTPPSVSTGSRQSYCGPPWMHSRRKKRPLGSMASSLRCGPAHGGVGSFVGRTEHTPIHHPP